MEYVFNFKREELTEALLCTGVAVQKKGISFPQQSSVHITFSNNNGVCKALFRTMSESASADYMMKEPLMGKFPEDNFITAVAVEYAKLYHVISKSKKEIIHVKWDPAVTCFRIIAEGTTTLNTITSQSWIIPPADDIIPFIKDFKIDDLVSAWRSTSFAIAQEISEYDLHGILFDGDWVTSNGNNMAIYSPESGAELAETPRIFIATAIENFIRLIDSTAINVDSMELRKRRNSQIVIIMHTKMGGFRYMVALNSAKFPDYKTALEKVKNKAVYEMVVSRPELLEVFSRMSIFLNVHRSVMFDRDNETLRITAAAEDTAEKTTETIPIISHKSPEGTGIQDAFHVKIGYDIFNKILSENKKDEITIRYGEDKRHLFAELDNRRYIMSTLREV